MVFISEREPAFTNEEPTTAGKSTALDPGEKYLD